MEQNPTTRVAKTTTRITTVTTQQQKSHQTTKHKQHKTQVLLTEFLSSSIIL
jgi:hypothetical protein